MSDKIKAVLLIPLKITDSMIAAGTSVPVVDSAAGEVAWSGATTYAVDDQVNHAGMIWEAQKASTNIEPGTDGKSWLPLRPSNRMAPFDDELDTVTRAAGEIVYVLQPGFFTGLHIWGMAGDQFSVQIYDAPGGDLVEQYSADLWEQAGGLFEYLFMPLKRRTQHAMRNLPLHPNPEVRITIMAANNAPCEVALITVGHWDTLIGAGTWGGTEYEAVAEVKSYTYRRVLDDGRVQRVRRGASNDVDCDVIIQSDEANHAMELLHEVQGRPVAFIASGLPRYEFLNGFGDVSGSVTAAGPNHARVRLRIDGAVQGVKQ